MVRVLALAAACCLMAIASATGGCNPTSGCPPTSAPACVRDPTGGCAQHIVPGQVLTNVSVPFLGNQYFYMGPTRAQAYIGEIPSLYTIHVTYKKMATSQGPQLFLKKIGSTVPAQPSFPNEALYDVMCGRGNKINNKIWGRCELHNDGSYSLYWNSTAAEVYAFTLYGWRESIAQLEMSVPQLPPPNPMWSDPEPTRIPLDGTPVPFTISGERGLRQFTTTSRWTIDLPAQVEHMVLAWQLPGVQAMNPYPNAPNVASQQSQILGWSNPTQTIVTAQDKDGWANPRAGANVFSCAQNYVNFAPDPNTGCTDIDGNQILCNCFNCNLNQQSDNCLANYDGNDMDGCFAEAPNFDVWSNNPTISAQQQTGGPGWYCEPFDRPEAGTWQFSFTGCFPLSLVNWGQVVKGNVSLHVNQNMDQLPCANKGPARPSYELNNQNFVVGAQNVGKSFVWPPNACGTSGCPGHDSSNSDSGSGSGSIV